MTGILVDKVGDQIGATSCLQCLARRNHRGKQHDNRPVNLPVQIAQWQNTREGDSKAGSLRDTKDGKEAEGAEEDDLLPRRSSPSARNALSHPLWHLSILPPSRKLAPCCLRHANRSRIGGTPTSGSVSAFIKDLLAQGPRGPRQSVGGPFTTNT